MADIIKLHPSVREHRTPRMSAAALSEYLIMKPDQQETVLHNSRFASPPVVTPYFEAMNAIRAYCGDPLRPNSVINAAKESLTGKSHDGALRPKAREEALRCLETLSLFEGARNALGLNGLSLCTTDRYQPLIIEGVRVSIQPDLLIRPQDSDGGKLGVVMFRPQKAPDPEACRLEETRRQRGEHRREMGRYMLAMAHLLVDDQPGWSFDRVQSIVADIRLQERISFSSSDHSARVRAIKAACRQIGKLWNDIEPRQSVLAKA
ncbi:hypothetical protein IFR23_14660 [Sphingomonas sp. CFBP 13603]|uniref:hypothetical protein n=1 Tax=Sphingomonas sp. CFBP 13603 TaxID=2774040 RepID=UPI0018681ECE|nr:hypothetical protein [Sphingomonas sp. CFBP 13603]MBE2993244.1 hypothetical protein [Sphingomonas sp. CFBP 13603]